MNGRREIALKRVEQLITLLSIALISYISISMLREHYESSGNRRFTVLSPGQAVPIEGTDWKKSHHTLILAISTDCHFCAESASFYRRLLKEQMTTGWQAIVVFPQNVETARTYVQSKGYPVSQVRQEDFATLGITATPTLLLVDQSGKLQQEWIGKLSASEENDVASHLGISKLPECKECGEDDATDVAMNRPNSPLIATSELSSLLKDNQEINLIDVRDRDQYQHGHLASAVNIPLQDLSTRAAHEVPPSKTTLVYCHFSAACQYSGIPSLCSNATAKLRQANITNFRVIRDPLPLLQEAGLAVAGSADRP